MNVGQKALDDELKPRRNTSFTVTTAGETKDDSFNSIMESSLGGVLVNAVATGDKDMIRAEQHNVQIITLPEEDVQPRLERHLSALSTGTNDSSLQIETLKDDGRFDSFSSVSLSWKGLQVSADVTATGLSCCKKRDDAKVDTKHILKQVSGIVEPGQFVAIMGASGAGKTTLLNTLAFRNESKLQTEGEIHANGWPIDKQRMSLISAYVQQEDYFIGTLTVKEVMMFHANLRMDKTISKQQKSRKVDAILAKLGLTRVQDSLCGFPGGLIRGISGGERKRLSVATELLMDPPLLFIDEPTSGLDSFMAESIVKLIGKLAKANRTILCTIHQPNSEVYSLFDRVCLVAEGNIAYMGTTSAALQHFTSIHLPCPTNYNPADHFIFSLAIRPGDEERCRRKVEEITNYFKKTDEYHTMQGRIEEVDRVNNASKPKQASRKKIQANGWYQMVENLQRSFLNTVRNPSYTRMRIFQTLIMALLCGLAYFNTKNNQEVAQNKSGVLFFLVVSFTFGNVFIHTQSIPLELPVIKREYQNGMYGVTPYLISKIITEIPFVLAMPLLQMGICYFMIGLRKDVMAFIVCYIACVGVTWASTGLGMFIAAWTGDVRIAGAVAAPIIMPFFLFGGLYQNDRSTPIYFSPVKYISWFRYGFNMLMINEFEGIDNITCEVGEACTWHNGTQVLHSFGIDNTNIWWPNLAALGLFGLVMCVIALSCLKCRVLR